MRRRALAPLLFALMPVFGWDSSGADVGNQERVERELIGAGPDIVIPGPPGTPRRGPVAGVVSPDGCRQADFADDADGILRLYLDGASAGNLGSARVYSPAFSPDGKRLAYLLSANGRDLLVLYGEQSYPVDGTLAWGPHFSPDSRHLIYVLHAGKTQRMVIDGKAQPRFDVLAGPCERVAAGGCLVGYVFAPGARRFGYTGTRDGKDYAVIDGALHGPFDRIGACGPVFSADGIHSLFLATRGTEGLLVHDGVEGRAWEEIISAAFSADGKHLVALVQDQGERRVLIDDVLTPDRNVVSGVELNPRTGAPAYAIKSPEGERLVLDGVAGAPFKDLSDSAPVFSPDGRRVATATLRFGLWHPLVDGRRGPGFESLGPL